MGTTIPSYLETVAIILIWQSIVFAVLSAGIYKHTRHRPKLFISGYMLVNAAYFLVVWMNLFGYPMVYRYLYPLALPLLVSFFPLFYFYIRSLIIPDYRLQKKQWLHLMPALFIFLLAIPYYLFPEKEALRFISGREVSNEFSGLSEYLIWVRRITFYGFFTLQFLFYILKFRTNLKLHRIRIELMFSYKEKLDLGWMRSLFIAILLFFIGNDLIYFFREAHPWLSIGFYCLGMLLINFFIGYQSLIQSEVVENEIIARMSHYCALHREMTIPRSESSELLLNRDLHKYQGSALRTDLREQITHQLDQLMVKEELYTDSQINIEDLAMKLTVSSKNLSQVINEVYQKNFFNYINELRINKAQTMLTRPEHMNLSIEGIAKVVGFQSKSSFYTAFKKTTGITPTAFRARFTESGQILLPD